MNRESLYWAAGFLEGEGSFCGDRRKHPSFEVGAVQVNAEPLQRLQALFGGTLTLQKRERDEQKWIHADRWRWRCYGPRARGVALTLFVMLSMRRRQQILRALRLA